MKLTLTKFSLTYAREAHLKAEEVRKTFIAEALKKTDDGVYEMPINKYKRLDRTYTTRQRQCARRYWRKSKSIRKLMTTSDNWK